MIGYMKLSLCLALMITTTTLALASRRGEKLHFQDSTELGEFDIDERPGNGHGHGQRNHRGRGRYHQHQQRPRDGNVAEFEENLPLLEPVKGPVQPPLVLSTHPGRGLGLQKHKFAPNQDNDQQTYTNLPLQEPSLNNQASIFDTQPQPVPPFQQNPYDGNPFLNKLQTPSAIPTNKYNPTVSQGVTNQLPTSDKPATTTPAYLNPRRTDLFYGSNLLEEETNREAKSEQTEISFIDRGLFDTAPHCKDGQILVNNRCRLQV